MNKIHTKNYRLTFEHYEYTEGEKVPLMEPVAVELRYIPQASNDTDAMIDSLFQMLAEQVKSNA